MDLDSRLFKDVIDSMSDGVLIVNREQDIVYANKAYARISSRSIEDIIGQKLPSFCENPLLPGVMKTGIPINSIRKKVIGDVQAYVSMSPLISNGEIVGGISVFKTLDDVNHLAEYSLKIKQMRNRSIMTTGLPNLKDSLGQVLKI
jgi:transcriptional regulator with PAS, ATPase and Fis domain